MDEPARLFQRCSLRAVAARLCARRSVAILLAVLSLTAQPAGGMDSTLVAMGTGMRTGVYYLAGGAVCALVNDERWEHGTRCLTERSNGSIENLRALRSGQVEFGIVQSDWHHHAVHGTSVFEEVGPDRDLRSVFALYPEPFTVIAHPDAGIGSLADLRGKRVNVGPLGSGSRATMSVVMQALGWTEQDFAYVADLGMGALPRALCRGEVDAAVFIVAHPNLGLEDMVRSCDAVLVPVQGPEIERLVEEHPYYFAHEIPGGLYPGQPSVPTFALSATLLTSARVPPGIVYQVTEAVFRDLDSFREVHPAFAGLEPTEMLSEGLEAPLHDGARRYYEDAGLQ
jgi:uncharacterized protein